MMTWSGLDLISCQLGMDLYRIVTEGSKVQAPPNDLEGVGSDLKLHPRETKYMAAVT